MSPVEDFELRTAALYVIASMLTIGVLLTYFFNPRTLQVRLRPVDYLVRTGKNLRQEGVRPHS
jgi:hypothetical protein